MVNSYQGRECRQRIWNDTITFTTDQRFKKYTRLRHREAKKSAREYTWEKLRLLDLYPPGALSYAREFVNTAAGRQQANRLMRGQGSQAEIERFQDLRRQHWAYFRVKSRNKQSRGTDTEIEFDPRLSEEVNELENS